jgi:hypothetical protein
MLDGYYAGLDLGRPAEFTALAVLERTSRPDPNRPGRELGHFAMRHLERFLPGTPYPEIGARVALRYAEPTLAGSTLAVDQTAAGRPVLDLLCRGRIQARLRAITITAGLKAVPDVGGGGLVPKAELVSLLQVLLQTRRLKLAEDLPEATTLKRELQTLRAKLPAEDDSVIDWRERPHDDLVLALAIAAWIAERGRREFRVWL